MEKIKIMLKLDFLLIIIIQVVGTERFSSSQRPLQVLEAFT